ncbi:MAG TPA: SMP-30/gluconolactonase/LRE family protein [Vicinamibacterales bacterium]|nr:SMP-30/gluconolactonase/LRE family protein [Vicinamibacterales bacterium]
MRRAIVIAVLVVVAIWAAWWLERYRWAGGFRTVTPHFAGACRPVEGVPGPEDLLVDRTTGIAYVSSYDRPAVRAGKPVPGAILAYDLNRRDAAPVNLTPRAAADFRPHGMSLYRGADGARLFVINHPPGGDVVEVFDLRADGLRHLRTIRDPALASANDLVAVDSNRFFVTNSRRHTTGVRGWLESNLRLSWGNVVYYDGARFSTALDAIAFPNGIDVDRRTGDLYVVSSFDQSVRVYGRDAATGALTFRREVEVGTRLDNVNVSQDGDLWVAGRAQYLQSPQPSQVVRIRRAGSSAASVEEVYVNKGDEIGNASAAAAHGRRLLIGSSGGNRFLDCLMR